MQNRPSSSARALRLRSATLTLLAAGVVAAPFAFIGCGKGDSSGSCSVKDNGDDTATITCPDGESVTVKGSSSSVPGPAGADGANGADGADGDSGSDGADGQDGDDGDDGADGDDGTSGVDGTNCTLSELPPNGTLIECGETTATVCSAKPTADVRHQCQKASDQIKLAQGLTVEYLTRNVANAADQIDFWPAESANPTHIVLCIEGSRELLSDGRYNPSVQSVNLETREVHTVLRGMTACDGIRVTPWGTVIATEEADTGSGFYEMLFDPASDAEYTISDRGAQGAVAAIVDEGNQDATSKVVKRTALASISWEGLGVLPSGVLVGGDELRPGTGTADMDGGALFKFIPTTLRTGNAAITQLSDSPFVAGKSYALRVSCTTGTQYGQGCEIGNGQWMPVGNTTARPEADSLGATGFYRPEDLHVDPHFAGNGVRYCFANTGDKGASNYGEVMCAVDSQPTTAPDARSVVINRLLEGDSTLNQPDNFAFHPTIPGLFYVIEDNAGDADVWACIDDGADRDIKHDGCVRLFSVNDASAEPTGFILAPDGSAIVAIQHSADGNMPKVDGYATDDLLHITGFTAQSVAAIQAFGSDTATSLSSQSQSLFGFGTPVAASATVSVARSTTFPGGVAPSVAQNGFGGDASPLMSLAGGLSAKYLTRIIGNAADQGDFWPYGATNPDYLLFCIEGSAEEINASGKLNPSVQAIDLETGAVKTVLRGMDACDGLRVTPWGTVLATEEVGLSGGVYEILWDPASNVEYSIIERGTAAGPATIHDSVGADASGVVAKRTALPAMAWEGMLVTTEGVVIGGDELRPGTAAADADGGALFKFVPTTLRAGNTAVTQLSQSPFVSGSSYALRVSCTSGSQYGQGCEIGNGQWIAVNAATATVDANTLGATGYYRPEDLEGDPTFTGAGVRFCFANTGSASAKNYGEILCAVDPSPTTAPNARNVVINRFLEGDAELNQPDNIEIQPGSGIVYVIEDNPFGDIWACLPDGPDRDNKTDGCVRLLGLVDQSSEPTGFLFDPTGTKAFFAVQHSDDPAGSMVDDYNTDDVVEISGFAGVTQTVAQSFGAQTAERLKTGSAGIFGFASPAP